MKAIVGVIRDEEGRKDEGKADSHPLGASNARPVDTHLLTHFLLRNETERHLVRTHDLYESCTF